MIRKIKELINKCRYQRVIKNNNHKDILYVDLGSTSVKMCCQNELIQFKASIREITNTILITPAMSNWVSVNNNYYIIGEANKSNEVCFYKYERKYLEVLILYGVKLLRSKGVVIGDNLKVNILVPFTELKYIKVLEDKINGLYQTDIGEIILTLNKSYVEGESSGVFFKEHYKVAGNLIVCNIGGKTSDITIINSNNSIEKIMSINMGIQSLLSEIVKYTSAPSSNILSNWLQDNYKFSKEEEIHLKEVNKDFINNIYNDLIVNAIKLTNPQNTTILFTGGGSLILKNEIQELLKDYKVKVLNQYESVYSDILGAMILSKETIKLKSESIPNETIAKEIILDEEIKERKSMYQQFVELFEAGLSAEEIMDRTRMAKQTFKNYKSRYNKELKLT